MHAALVLVAQVIANSNPAPMPLVLDGCNTASAIRAAEIREMSVRDNDTLANVADLLLEKDGAICLMESEVLVDLFAAHPGSDIVAHTLVQGLGSDMPHIAARAAELVVKIGFADTDGYGRLLRRADVSKTAWRALRIELDQLPRSPRQSVLVLLTDRLAPVARAAAR